MWALPALAEPVRVATYNTGLSRDGPGLLLRDILRDAPQVQAVAKVIASAAPDVILLQDVDYDAGLVAARALRDRVRDFGHKLEHVFAFAPNTGVPSGFDLNSDGRSNGFADAHGYGRYAGQAGMVLLSRFPIRHATDHSLKLWADWDGADPAEIRAAWGDGGAHLRLASTGQWLVTLDLPSGQGLTLLAFHATPPVFDGPEDRNGLRNRDELRFLAETTEGIDGYFILLGDANNDPQKGEGRNLGIKALLDNPRLSDPLKGMPTVDWRALGLGWMRVDYILPAKHLRIADAGRYMASPAEQASRHRLTWVDIALP
jgi:endonuclease/exonuclease/phosphatase family metal-dependent hydrolase